MGEKQRMRLRAGQAETGVAIPRHPRRRQMRRHRRTDFPKDEVVLKQNPVQRQFRSEPAVRHHRTRLQTFGVTLAAELDALDRPRTLQQHPALAAPRRRQMGIQSGATGDESHICRQKRLDVVIGPRLKHLMKKTLHENSPEMALNPFQSVSGCPGAARSFTATGIPKMVAA
ncbi:hypothetical protein SDC9_116811 [bioreactor metagenome]|uniref:Uncharacterized protein n=1 Tax=bioreactor metagenome TaxID=1076179 RepID=A0A645C3E9_9ZZZZ